jgi:3'-phosphoadenosine 5'-phosphosulfate sulfotransferase (PAPS reductase)/FAD synthetase
VEYVLFTKTIEELKESAVRHDNVIVGFSGGKDSWCCLDLCMKVFKNVTAFFMYLIPDLECVEVELNKARQKYGITILQYPHWLLFRCIKYGTYCDGHWKNSQAIWEPKINDIHKAVIADTGINLICQGAKEADSMWRRRYFTINKFEQIIYPLKKWQKIDVLSYLKINNIPLPDSSGKNATGVDLSTPSLLWLYDNYPNDFKKLLQFFPYAEAVVKRREYYGK